ncbi:MAG: ABC transporter ATP-binding protein [Lachnospiraceae bacterium]|nr:ABC transporter ATP-binding protein [Lachnospiraceae bacterium]
MGSIIEIKNLTKHYGKYRGVEDISFQVQEGDIFAFLGPNGAGKSTTIRAMLGMIGFEQGEITIMGKDAVREKQTILKEIGYMPSEAMFYPAMRVKDVIRFAADMRRLDCSREAERLCEELQVDKDKRIRELSLGNRKKVSIVCALQHKPKLLILDEPTSGLDPLMQEAFFRLLQEANREGTTCFLSSHVLSEVKKYCHNAAIIKNGRVLKVDTVEKLSHTKLRLVKTWKNGKEESFTHTGAMSELLQKLTCMAPEDVLIEEPSLEELFMQYYEEEK